MPALFQTRYSPQHWRHPITVGQVCPENGWPTDIEYTRSDQQIRFHSRPTHPTLTVHPNCDERELMHCNHLWTSLYTSNRLCSLSTKHTNRYKGQPSTKLWHAEGQTLSSHWMTHTLWFINQNFIPLLHIRACNSRTHTPEKTKICTHPPHTTLTPPSLHLTSSQSPAMTWLLKLAAFGCSKWQPDSSTRLDKVLL